ncbi:hypothetical protein BWI75_16385 [Gloeocapsopsis sp. AAB1 = 1H9]|uniref:Uncharacterized protein n=1 Tax=Gloeocapsopsis dulcis AAB1 = 1H9 TaxID=1433147 RepID=A0A6N8FY23_9CHRO|nr:hypothetical protein [Gloeocapsopsis dulcis AAB1 = 1H9]
MPYLCLLVAVDEVGRNFANTHNYVVSDIYWENLGIIACLKPLPKVLLPLPTKLADGLRLEGVFLIE